MKRRLQRRQRGIKSEECSYLTKLDPTMIAEGVGQQQKQQQQSPVLAKVVHGRFLNSTGSVRAPPPSITTNTMRNRMEAEKLNRGQNQFVKSFVQN